MRQRWLSKRALLFHLALLVWFPGCLVAAWWQVESALAGNGLSYLYSVEWPAFAIGGVYAWWLLVHIDATTPGRTPAEQLHAVRRARAHAAAARRATSAASAARPDATVGDMLVAHRRATASACAGGMGERGPVPSHPPARAGATRPSRAQASPRSAARVARRDRGVEEKLAAYNRRLARLATDGPQTWRRQR